MIRPFCDFKCNDFSYFSYRTLAKSEFLRSSGKRLIQKTRSQNATIFSQSLSIIIFSCPYLNDYRRLVVSYAGQMLRGEKCNYFSYSTD